MRRALLAILWILSTAQIADAQEYEPRDGDIIFHTSMSDQSEAIQQATGSRYSHVGVVYIRDGSPMVFEAIKTVQLTPLEQWIRRGEDGHFVVKRLEDAEERLDKAAKKKLYEEAKRMKGLPYDPYFQWDDRAIYCSELVWKIYHRALCKDVGVLETLKDFDLSHSATQEIFRERFGSSFPKDEPVISPAAIFKSKELELVHEEGEPTPVAPTR